MSRKSASSSRRTDQGNLLRGQACNNCRKRKIRCDAVRPVCGQCTRATRPQDACEYYDPIRSKHQALEDTVSELETRIQEMEQLRQPEAGPSSVPGIVLYASQDTQPVDNTLGPQTTAHSAVYLDPTSVTSGGTDLRSSPQPTANTRRQLEDPSPADLQILVDNFLNHATEFGFFLDRQRFRQSVMLPLPLGDHSRPAPALLSAVYLLGQTISQAGGRTQQEQPYLSFSLQLTSTATIDDHPLRIIHKLQAVVLLSNYFFRNGRFLEARYHASNACTLAVACGLHRIESATGTTAATLTIEETMQPPLDPPSDNTELEERITAFWTVFSLHNLWSAAFGNPISLVFNVVDQTNLPWSLPQPTPEHEQPLAIQGSETIHNFITNGEDGGLAGATVPALFAKAALLFERSTNLASRYLSGDQVDAAAMTAEFHSLDLLAENVRNRLPTLEQIHNAEFPLERSVIVAHALTNATVIKLHSLFMRQNDISRQRCIAASEAMIHFAHNEGFIRHRVINPIMAILWPIACQILMDEIARLRTVREQTNQPYVSDREAQLGHTMESAIQIMGAFAQDSPSMGIQLTKVQMTYASLEI